MKKILLVTILALFGTTAFAAPTLYGLVNKELRYVKQESKFKKEKFSGVQEINAWKTRIGAKGKVEADGINGAYVIELGVSGEADATDLRMAKLDLMVSWGTITLGKDWTATSKIGVILDPLNKTGANAAGVDLNGDVQNMTGYIGYYSRWRRPLVGYKTPKFAGLQLAITMDRNGNQANTATTDNVSTAKPSYMSNLLTYEKKFGNMGINTYIGHIKASGSGKVYDTDSKIGAKFTISGLAFTGLYSIRKKKLASGKSEEFKNILASAGYTAGKHNIATTYSIKDSDSAETGAITDKNKESQIALGYQFTASKNIALRATYAMVKIEEESPAMVASENDANVFMTGAMLNF